MTEGGTVGCLPCRQPDDPSAGPYDKERNRQEDYHEQSASSPTASGRLLKTKQTMRKLLSLYLLWLAIGAQAQQQQPEDFSAARKLQIAEFAIQQLYVDPVNEDKIVESAIIEMLRQLDPHSTYANAEEVKRLNEPLEGNFEGIGIQFNMNEDTLMVIQVIPDGPSEKAGLLPGDRIISVNDTAIAGVKMKNEAIVRRLRGPKGSQVNLGVVRRGIAETLHFTVTRDKIPVHSIDAVYMYPNHVGYVRINNFGATTVDEFMDALKRLKKQGMRDLVLDLQGNGGGYLNAAVGLANQFLERDEMIVYTEGRRSPRNEFRALGNGQMRTGKLIVLVDEFTASAAEIVTGSVQDWDRALVVGRRSFGKGLVQRPVDLPDGSMIRLTIARYYTPSGRCIQKPYDNPENYNADLINRYNRGEMTNADSIHFPDSLKCTTLKLGRTVYGGGGIMPDYFVPIDTTRSSDYHRQLLAKGAIIKATLQYVDGHRNELQKTYKKFADFDRSFTVPESLHQALIADGNEVGAKYDEAGYQKAKALIDLQLKALIARDIWGMSEYYQVVNHSEPTVQKALELMAAPDFNALLRKK